jgi:hypothetical protein
VRVVGGRVRVGRKPNERQQRRNTDDRQSREEQERNRDQQHHAEETDRGQQQAYGRGRNSMSDLHD